MSCCATGAAVCVRDIEQGSKYRARSSRSTRWRSHAIATVTLSLGRSPTPSMPRCWRTFREPTWPPTGPCPRTPSSYRPSPCSPGPGRKPSGTEVGPKVCPVGTRGYRSRSLCGRLCGNEGGCYAMRVRGRISELHRMDSGMSANVCRVGQ
ncbi:hypothetical protein SMALB_0150 [Streptomyces malaysiensis]|uniref:Uncharacterized protein n=1 Tax=Streptomyces malaysiensis TaxID=92644 RepID=A0A7X5WYN3_STRMQ|nr:hypothetical protein [Streptomyces malaysiensis]